MAEGTRPQQPHPDAVWNSLLGKWMMPDGNPAATASSGFVDNAGRTHGSQETVDANNAAMARVSGTDWGSVEAQLREKAKQAAQEFGYEGPELYNDTNLEDVKRQLGYDRPAGDLSHLINERYKDFQRRAADQDGGGESAPSGGNWFASNAPGGGFTEQYSTLARPDYLQGPYVPPTFTETFTPLSQDELFADPGYQHRLDTMRLGQERSAAAQGRILSGGYVGRALPRALGEFASQEYGAANDRKFNQYLQRYGQFQDTASMAAQARNLNEGAYQADVGNHLNQYNARYRAYQDAIGNNLDFARLGLSATTAGAPS
jgi:hypothetical protein